MARGEPVTVETVVVPDPAEGEAVVRVQACGVCHTDLHYRDGGIADDFPFLLGHEAAGVVEQVGPGVSDLAPGDYVVVAWRAPCGTCRSCRRGRPWYCFASRNARQPMTLADGTPLSPALGIGAFLEFTLVAAAQAVKIDRRARPEAAGLIGCGVMAGFGAAVNTAGVRLGDTVAVIGCGGVGNAAIAGAVVAGARTVIAVDVDFRKLDWAKRFGATHTVDSRRDDPVEVIRELTDGFGADVVIVACSSDVAQQEAMKMAAPRGRVLFFGGLPKGTTHIQFPSNVLHYKEVQVHGSYASRHRDQVAALDMLAADAGGIRSVVSDVIGLDETPDAFPRIRAGEALKVVVAP